MQHLLKQEPAQPVYTVKDAPEPSQANRGPHVTFGYNAIQLGLTPVDFGEASKNYRLRAYTNVGIENDSVHVRFSGFNERGVEYSFGRNTLRAGANDYPVDIVVASRYFGAGATKASMLDIGVGVRVDLAKLPLIDYGFADIIKQSGVGASDYRGPQITTFWGKQIKDLTVESTMAIQKGSPIFLEVEVLMKPIAKIAGQSLVPFARDESYNLKNHTFTAGMQLQLVIK